MPIVVASGFKTDEYGRELDADPRILPFEEGLAALHSGTVGVALDLPNDEKTAQLVPHLAALALIAVDFPAFSDGRGFSLAKRLRDAGYGGRLRAVGGVIPDQFAYALACGFDEVEIDEARAERQPEPQWLADVGRPGWYQRDLSDTAPET